MKTIFQVLTSKRFKSFYWRTAMMSSVGFINLVVESLTSFGLSGQYVVITGLILGEISKAINNKVSGK